MIVVSDASPLIGLAHLGRLELLRHLYTEIVVPGAVYEEVAIRRADRPGAAEIRDAAWIAVRELADRVLADQLGSELGRGESEAIALAAQTPGALLLVDEHRARKAASRMGVEVIGIVGVLTEAKRRGLILAVRPLLDSLIHTAGFRIGPRLYHLVLEREGEQ